MSTPSPRDELVRLDERDPLAALRRSFAIPEGIIYLDGNSLGAALARVLGARAEDVMVADSTSVNLFRLVCVALQIRPERRVMLIERDNFPADNYVAQGIAEWLGGKVELRECAGDEIETCVFSDVALVLASHVDFRSGRMLDMEKVTRAVHGQGAIMLWDLSHSAGAMPLALDVCDVDLAVGCGYKYLNGGPGAPSYVYMHRRWQSVARPPIFGWLGHETPFAFETGWRPASGIRRLLGGTPPILSLVALQSALGVFDDVDMAAVRAKSLSLTTLFMDLVEQRCSRFGVRVVTPRAQERRGSQVSLAFEHAHPAVQALVARGVIGDFRTPDVMRFGFAPLYVRYADVWDAAVALEEVLSTGAWDRPEFKRREYVT